MDLRQAIDHGPMTGLQFRVVGLCFFLNMLDGIDILSLAFSAPLLSRQWSIAPATLGVVFSAALAGMAAGSILLTPIGDAIGRRKLLLFSLALIAVGMLGTVLTTSVGELLVLRFITGCGLGGVVPTMATLAAEFAPRRRRNFAVTLVQGGYTLGAALTGLVGLWLLPAFGWQALFALGGTMTLIMVPAVVLLMPESPDFLLARRPPGALQALNKTLRAMHRPTLAALPEAAKARPGLRDFLASLRLLFSTEYRMPTVLLWVAFFMSFATLYFLQSWVPQLTANAGLPDEQAFWAGTILNFGSFTGMASVGFFADRFGLRRVISTYLGVGAVALLFFGYLETTAAILIGLGLIGLMQGGFIGLYAVGAQIYPAAVRTTGVGWAIGVARPGAVLGPAFAGLLVAEGLGMAANFRVFALPLVIAAIAVLSIRARALDAPAAADSTPEGDLSAARTPASAARET